MTHAKARMIPQFQLVDSNGREYEESDNAFYLADSLGTFKTLNPDVTTSGYIVFDVPPGRYYHLRVDGGFESAFIEIPLAQLRD